MFSFTISIIFLAPSMFFSFLLFSCSALAANVQYSLEWLGQPPARDPICIRNGISFTLLNTSQTTSKMLPPDALNMIMNMPELCFTIRNTEYLLHPSKHLIEKRKHGNRCLGYFSSVSISNSKIILKYKDGDKTATSNRYSSSVEFVASEKEYASRSLGNEIGKIAFKFFTNKILKESKTVQIGMSRSANASSNKRKMADMLTNEVLDENIVPEGYLGVAGLFMYLEQSSEEKRESNFDAILKMMNLSNSKKKGEDLCKVSTDEL